MLELKTQKEKKKKKKNGVPIPKREGEILGTVVYDAPFFIFIWPIWLLKRTMSIAVEALCDEHFNCVVVTLQGWKISGIEKLKTKLKDTWRPYHLSQNL